MPNLYHTRGDPARRIWEEPVRGAYPDPALIALSGRERLDLWLRRLAVLPPLTRLTGARPLRVGAGTAEAEMPASGWLAASNGLLTGGTLAILADVALGCSVETELPPATPYTTAELSLSLLRPVRCGPMLQASGQVIHVGRSVGLSEAFVLDDRERLLAHGTSRLNVFPRIADPPPTGTAGAPASEPEHELPDPYLRPPPDGILPAEAWRELAGLEILRRQQAGELPAPALHHLTGIRPIDFGHGAAVVAMPASEWLASPTRMLQGGAIAMLADFAMLTAVETTAPPAVPFAGLDLKVNYLRPCPPGDHDLTARAEVVHRGRTLAIARAEVSNPEGKAVALATGSSMYLPGQPADLAEEEFAARADQ